MTGIDLSQKAYCNCLAQERGLDPVGHARSFDDAIVIEAPLPWKLEIMQQAGALPQQVIDLLALWGQRYQAGEGYPHMPLLIAPDKAYSQEGHRRVIFYTRPAGLFSEFNKVEYLVPTDEVGALVWALYEDREALPRFESYSVALKTRDILVCTHGTVDAACAKFGYPLYKHIRDNCDVRVWRVSHFGGHVFAPTLMDMPTGHFWAYIGQAQADQIVQRSGDVAALRGYYRGWAGVETGFAQAAERDLWQQYGWAWFDYLKSAETLAQDANEPEWADVRVRWSMPNAAESAADLHVKIKHMLETRYSTASENTYAYPQYQVLEREGLI